MEDLKIFEIIIDEMDKKLGINYVSLVDRPAVEYNFLTFNKENQKFTIQNKDQKIVLGVIMLADTPIYRNNETFGEHYVIFSKNTIKDMILKYFKEDKINMINLNHNKIVKEGAYLFQSYIVDKELGMTPPTAFKDIPDGSWIGAYKIEDDILWNSIQTGLFNGFSIEGFFQYGNEMQLVEDLEEEFRQIHKLLAQIK